jgi:glycosyltransferase A (GT-A) superfamily protein (DUF2064 family)
MINKRPNSTALMVFSRSNRLEAQKKRLFGRNGNLANSKAIDWLIRHTAKVAESSGIDVIWVDEMLQRGNSFGARLTNAFVEIFNKGYENIIAIANDCPDISIQVLEDAHAHLKEDTVVLGPAIDGGDYLIGINKKNFKSSSFEHLPWNTSDLHHAVLQYAEAAQMEIVTLVTLADIDDRKALKQYLAVFSFSRFAHFIKRLLESLKINVDTSCEDVPQSYLNTDNSLRAPPFFLPLAF